MYGFSSDTELHADLGSGTAIYKIIIIQIYNCSYLRILIPRVL